jgi:hypothetical protein
MHALYSPYIIPVVAMLIPIVAIISGAIGKIHADRLRSDQRLAMLARGIPIDEIERILMPQDEATIRDALAQPTRPASAARTAGQIRLTATILIFSGLSLIAFFAVLAPLLHDPDIYAGAAAGIVPVGVGLGFLVDYRSRLRELARMREDGGL